MNSKFKFYEVVEVASDRPALSEINSLKGAILGMAQNSSGCWNYSVQIFETEECWDVGESELIRTGKRMKREDFYDGDSISVEVDGRTGDGKIINNEMDL